MRRFIAQFFLMAVLLFGFAGVTRAQSYDLSWHTIAGGGGTSTGGVYSVSGTIGQAAAGNLAGGNYSITGGFWGIIATVQTPGAPMLSIAAAATNHVTLSWASAFGGYVLQQEANLSVTNWSAVDTNAFPIKLSNGTNSVTVPVGGNQYFRLTHP